MEHRIVHMRSHPIAIISEYMPTWDLLAILYKDKEVLINTEDGQDNNYRNIGILKL